MSSFNELTSLEGLEGFSVFGVIFDLSVVVFVLSVVLDIFEKGKKNTRLDNEIIKTFAGYIFNPNSPTRINGNGNLIGEA